MLKTCGGKVGNYHDDICFETEECPLCEALKNITKLEKEIDELKEEAQNG